MRQTKRMLICGQLAAIVTATAPATQAQEQRRADRPATQPAVAEKAFAPEKQAIVKTGEEFVQAFNRHDAKALANLWTEQGEYIDETGAVISGRAAIEREFAEFFKQRPRVQMQSVITSLRVLGPNAAVEEGDSMVSEPEVGDTSTAHYSVMHVKENGRWLMASVRDQESKQLSNYGKLESLEPLIGEWMAKSPEGRMETSCRWQANRNFIYRDFTAYRGDKAVGGGFEIIGFDPSLGEITSWHFSQDGGIGRGVWKREGNKWVIHTKGTMPDGRSTSATNVLTAVDPDTFTWASYDRSVGNQPVQDTPVAKIVRNSKQAQTGR